MAEVRLEGVDKAFQGVAAVRNLSLTVQDQEFLAIVGPSGCGKSTTLRLVCGLDNVSRGQVYFDDKPVGHLPANRRDVAMVFQSYALYPHMTVTENIGFALRVMGVSKQKIRRRVTEVAQILEIEELLDRRPRELSGGQRQRVALGRAIARDAGAYLLDEPLSNLDAQLRVVMRGELKKLHREISRTFVYVTHDQVEAMTMSDRIAVMSGGVLQQCAAPMEVYERPANVFVASFIGSPPMNFLRGDLQREDGALHFRGEGVDQPITPDRHAELDQAGEHSVLLGIRPEDITLSATPHEGYYPGSVSVEEPLGSEVLVTVNVGDATVKARVPPPFHTGASGEIYVGFAEHKLSVFAADDGRILSAATATKQSA